MKVVLKSTLEPQSEAEESKEEAGFTDTILLECNKFIEQLRSYEIAQEENIQYCVALKESQLDQIRQLTARGLTASVTGHISSAIKDLSAEISKLEKDLSNNRQLASNIILQLKAIFTKERAKF